MKRLILITIVSAFMAGPAMAQLPDGLNPDDYESGIYLLDPEPGNSWVQRYWIKPWEGWGTPDHYQFRICTNPSDTDYPQFFEPENFRIRGYGQPADSPWAVNPGSPPLSTTHLGVVDALMWVGGPNPPGSQGEFLWIPYGQGTIDTYVGPPQYFDVPEFVMQMQAYNGGTRIFNGEWYFDGTVGAPGYVGYVSPWHGSVPFGGALDSGATRAGGADWACPEWTVTSPIPVPGAVLLGLLGLGAAGIKLRKFT